MQCTFPYKKCGPGKNRNSVRMFSPSGKTCGPYTHTSPHVFPFGENMRTINLVRPFSLMRKTDGLFYFSFLFLVRKISSLLPTNGKFCGPFLQLFLVRKISFPLATYEKFCRLFLQFSFLVIKIWQICNSTNKIFSKIKAIFFGVVEKHNFHNIQQKNSANFRFC
jgi:hypothetical protein